MFWSINYPVFLFAVFVGVSMIDIHLLHHGIAWTELVIPNIVLYRTSHNQAAIWISLAEGETRPATVSVVQS